MSWLGEWSSKGESTRDAILKQMNLRSSVLGQRWHVPTCLVHRFKQPSYLLQKTSAGGTSVSQAASRME